MIGAQQGLLVDVVTTHSGQSMLGRYTIDVHGSVGTDTSLVGGPYSLELALVNPAGAIGAASVWQVEIIDELIDGCPAINACATGLSCGPDPICGVDCGSCLPSQACTAFGACEPLHLAACPDAAQCEARECGVDPVCGVACGVGCTYGMLCSVDGLCVVDPNAESESTTETGDEGTTGMESSTESESDTTGDTEDTTGDTESGDTGDCIPECGDRKCGRDPVCGESCGECEAGIACVNGVCDVCVPECGTRECGVDPVCGQLRLTNVATFDPSLNGDGVAVFSDIQQDSWFTSPTSPSLNYRLLSPSSDNNLALLQSIALQTALSPTADIDGRPRVEPGQRGYPGADQP